MMDSLGATAIAVVTCGAIITVWVMVSLRTTSPEEMEADRQTDSFPPIKSSWTCCSRARANRTVRRPDVA